MSDKLQDDGADHKEKAQRLSETLRKACFCLTASLVTVVLVVLVSCRNRKGDLAGLLLPPVSTTSTAAAVCLVQKMMVFLRDDSCRLRIIGIVIVYLLCCCLLLC